MNFGEAIEALKKGQCVQRTGWNGKGMHIYLEDYFHTLVGKGGGMEHARKYMPVLIMYTGQNTHQPGWNASTADVLADDWQIASGNDPVVTTDNDADLIQVDDADKFLDFNTVFSSITIKGYASFEDWAKAWFTADHLNRLIPLNVVIGSLKQRERSSISLRELKGALRAWCAAQNYEFNPSSLRGSGGRILRRYESFLFEEGAKYKPGKWVGTGESRTQEFIYIKTPAQTEIVEQYWSPTSTPTK